MEPNTPQNINDGAMPNSSAATSISSSNPAPITSPSKPSKPKALIATTVICAILAVAGIGFGVYGMLDANQKSQQTSDLKTDIANKNTTITELESTISDLKAKSEKIETVEIAESATTPTNPEPTVREEDNTIAVVLGDKLAENETRTVFKIGECTADGPSVKCPITTAKGDALISYNSNDSFLRFTLPNN